MAKATLEDKLEFFTLKQVSDALRINRKTLDSWVRRGITPPPTKTDANGVRLFNAYWIGEVRRIVKRLKD